MTEQSAVDATEAVDPADSDEASGLAGEPETEPEPVHEPEPEPVLSILLYASDRTIREQLRFALGRKVAADLPAVRVLEVATQSAVITTMDDGGVDLAILDGEAVPGGMGLCRQLKDEITSCPPILVLTGRRDDAWLATWSRADGVLPHPVDPIRLPETVAAMLRAGRGTSLVAHP